MRKFIYILVALTLALFSRYENAYAFTKGAEQECSKCHTLNADQAAEVMKPFAPDVKVLNILPGPIKGIWEVDFESGGKKSVVYLDYSKKILIAGNLIDTRTKINYSKESFDKLNKIDFSQIPLDNALVMGSKDAAHKIVVFDDPE
jgi:thiol:disulfide interchange protein DsbC